MFREGWTWLLNARKWHYFVDGRALCGKWLLFTTPKLVQGNDNSPDNCVACQKKLKLRKQKMSKETLDYLKSLEKGGNDGER